MLIHTILVIVLLGVTLGQDQRMVANFNMADQSLKGALFNNLHYKNSSFINITLTDCIVKNVKYEECLFQKNYLINSSFTTDIYDSHFKDLISIES